MWVIGWLVCCKEYHMNYQKNNCIYIVLGRVGEKNTNRNAAISSAEEMGFMSLLGNVFYGFSKKKN